MRENEIEDTGIELPRISAIEPLPGFSLKVRWSEGRRAGREDIVDLLPAIGSYKIYKPLRNDEELFTSAKLGDDGYAVAWDGSDLEMSADMIHALAEETMTTKDFAGFLQRNNLSQTIAAILLGRSRRQIANYISTGPIPRVVALACYGFEARKRDIAISKQLQEASKATGDLGSSDLNRSSGKAA